MLGAIKNKPRKYRFHGTGKSQPVSSKKVAVPQRSRFAPFDQSVTFAHQIFRPNIIQNDFRFGGFLDFLKITTAASTRRSSCEYHSGAAGIDVFLLR